MDYRVERIGPGDWERMREVRLAQLLDTPMAFMETYETALGHGEDEWRSRVARVSAEGSAGFAAVAPDGRWVGTMISFTPEPKAAVLVGVWTDPAYRGRQLGVTDAMLDAILDWARTEAGAERLLLRVHEDNPRATAFYRRRGFDLTGLDEPYELDPASRLLEMALPLS
ncbi:MULTISPECIES: N-acetyltransferase [unclassified Kitasatospora]|uniref:GNAT family N-acetyltransferase n=1 Tax=unclassified Kitasatospora TaxID=2633591 RepID=UPI001ADF9AF4|nr:GNAT family N-acetyltransferase [Kitasatospora sp. RG8]MBP0452574.1 GNAT family N-acetyltransferase [Kitasatospora sp. RG8]